MLGLTAIRDYIHAVESAFKRPDLGSAQAELDRLFEGAAALRRAIERTGTDEEQGAAARLAHLHPLDTEPASATPGAAAAPAEAPAPAATPAPAPAPPPEPAGEPEIGAPTETIRVPFPKLDELLNQVGELVGLGSTLDDMLDRHRDELESIRLRRALDERFERLARITAGLRAAAMDLRLVPIGQVLRRFPALARELAHEQGKRIRVVLEGEEVELDKSTVDILAEPLLHLVRNAVDHGIGTPQEREARGKPAEGTLILRAEPRGDQVRIEVIDDGAGLDREAIVARGRDLELIGKNEALSAEEAGELIFRSGFSTRREADMVSGRGIGLDVVARTVQRLRGRLEVEDAPGGGTCFVLQLPLTLAIIPALLFESAGETMALPVLDVEDTLRPSALEQVGAAEVIRHDDELIPLARPARLFGWSDANAPLRYAVVVRQGSRVAAVVADRLLEQRDIVVKGLPHYLGQPRGVSGVTVAPDGRVVLLLDAGGLIDLNLETHRRVNRARYIS